jgi:hypothetical protein
MTPDIATIAAGLSERRRESWKSAEWCGEYYIVPELVENSAWIRAHALADGLIHRDGNGGYIVTIEGERLIAYLNRPPFWRRWLIGAWAYLQEQAK